MLGTIDEVRLQLDDMRGHFKSGFSFLERDLLDELYLLLFSKKITITGCQDCYRDAYILICNKIKNMEKLPTYDYVLKSGVVIHPFGSADYYTNGMDTAVAEDWLNKHPEWIKDFAIYPSNWEERCGLAKNGTTEAAQSNLSVQDEDLPMPIDEVPQNTKKKGRKAKK